MTKRAALRAGDMDREQVAERLRHAATEGRLLTDELEERLAAAFSAKTYGELDAIVSDLPMTEVGRRRHSGMPIRARAGMAMVLAVSVAVVVVSALGFAFGGHAHAGHQWNGGGAPIMWLLWLAIGWRLLAHRGHRGRNHPRTPVRRVPTRGQP
jgi:Domain of unknown function (DUF1707)